MSLNTNGPLKTSSGKVVVLVDMDGVLCDLEASVLKSYRASYPDEQFIPLSERRGYWIDAQYRDIRNDLGDKINEVLFRKNFFLGLIPIEGAVESVKMISQMENVEVFICTSPIFKSYKNCIPEKYEWIERHLGEEWLKRIILTSDKTLVAGDILIDDKMEISGVNANRLWEHVVFTTAPNLHDDAGERMRMLSWNKDLSKLKALIISKF